MEGWSFDPIIDDDFDFEYLNETGRLRDFEGAPDEFVTDIPFAPTARPFMAADTADPSPMAQNLSSLGQQNNVRRLQIGDKVRVEVPPALIQEGKAPSLHKWVSGKSNIMFLRFGIEHFEAKSTAKASAQRTARG